MIDDERFHVGIDVGTTWTAAAVHRGGSAELVSLGERSPAIPSVIHVGADGVFAIGEAALRQVQSDPTRVVQEFTRRIGDRTPLVVGGVPTPPEALMARFVARVLQIVVEREGAPAGRVAATHPAGWGEHKLGALRHALTRHGMGSVVLLPEPQAAAIGYASAARVEAGTAVAVYDLGGGTFDAAIVRKLDADGGFALLGRPDGITELGGVDFDAAVFDHVRAELGSAWDELDTTDRDVLAAVAALRRDCSAAKETLSQDVEAAIPVTLPGLHTTVRLDRARFEELIRPAISETLVTLRAVIASADLTGGEAPTILLVGGSSRIPLVAELVRELGHPVAVDVDPKAAIALGAATAAHRIGGPRRVPGPPRPFPRPPATVAAPSAVPVPGVSAPTAPAPTDVAHKRSAPLIPSHDVQPFHQPASPQRVRLTAILGVVAAVVTVLVIGGSLLFYVLGNGPTTPVGPPAEAATPAAVTTDPVAPTAAGPLPPGARSDVGSAAAATRPPAPEQRSVARTTPPRSASSSPVAPASPPPASPQAPATPAPATSASPSSAVR